MIKIQIDGKIYEVQPGKNLLETCLALGMDLPYFCYHPAMGSVGACRQCAVKRFRSNEDKKGRIIMSCMEPVVDGMIISVEDPEAKAFRHAVIEGLMTNHPHDCPVCDEGGECQLQDMTVMSGHNYRRFDFKKRTYQNQYLGPFISHEMNRCIQCYRCVRFYKDYAGGKDFGAFSSRNNVYFGRQQEGVLESEFSGNLAEVCPTGVFTDKTLKQHFTRKWDLTNAPSICTHCSVGCNIIAGERYGTLRRIMSRYNGEVNGYFICDRGRFGYEFVNGKDRAVKPQVRLAKSAEPVSSEEEIISALKKSLSKSARVIGIGSPRASLESNFALSALVGRENFYHGISAKEFEITQLAVNILKNAPVHSASLKDIEKADAVLILGEDPTNTAPMVALAVRQAIKNKGTLQAVKAGIPAWNANPVKDWTQDLKSPVFIANPYDTKLDETAEKTFRGSPNDIARLGFAIAHHIAKNAPAIKSRETDELSREIATVLASAENPVIITGSALLNDGIIQAAANIATALNSKGRPASISIILPESNSMGLGMMKGKPLEEAVGKVLKGEVDTVILLENDLYRRMNKATADEFFGKTGTVIVLDYILTQSALKADILLPVGSFAESEGTLVSQEGRAQRFYRVFPYNENMAECWRELDQVMHLAGRTKTLSWPNFDDIVSEMAATEPVFESVRTSMPGAHVGMYNEKIRRQTIRFSGRTAMNANVAVSEKKPPQDPDSPLAFSMEGRNEDPPSSLVPFYWVPGWNSNQASNFYLDEPNGHLKGGDPGVRLFEKEAGREFDYFPVSLEDIKPGKDELLMVPVCRIFGSEELSSLGPAIAERVPEPFILLNPSDIASGGLAEEQVVEISIDGNIIKAAVHAMDSIPKGIAGVSTGLPGMPHLDLPAAGKIK